MEKLNETQVQTKETEVREYATADSFAEEIKALVRDNIIGIASKEKEDEFIFRLPGEKLFRVLVEDM